MDTPQVQVQLFQQIKSLLPSHISLVDAIADLLSISVDSAYRRIRGEKPVSIEELRQLCRTYKISLDQFLHLKSNSFLFSGNLANSTDFNFEGYLNDMLQQVEFINSFSTKHFYYLLKDVPPMTHFQIPELVAFKAFFWKKSILHYDDMRGKKFDITDINPEYIRLTGKIVGLYNQIPTTEIWNIEAVNSSIKQILFYHDANAFAQPGTANILLRKVEELIEHVEKQAEYGVKYTIDQSPVADAAAYRMFNNELILGDNTVLVELNDRRLTYLNHSGINFMSTQDERFNDYTYEVFKNLMSRSTQISSVSEKERGHFFGRIRERLKQSYTRL
jgi:transcriptional regulator with XRE-family HTH domain